VHDDSPTPLSLTARIVIALNEVRLARAENDPRECAWLSLLDRLLEAHERLLRHSGKWRPLKELDPELDARLSVKLDYKLIGGVSTNLS